MVRNHKSNRTLQALLPNTICYLICPAISKLTILSVLYRINPAFVYRIAVIGTAVFIFAYTLALCIITGGLLPSQRRDAAVSQKGCALGCGA
jgi:hypothetical protein